MKTIKSLLLALCLMIGLNTCAQTRIFKDLPGAAGAEPAALSRALLAMARTPAVVNNLSSRMPVKSLDGLKGIEVVQVDNKKYLPQVRTILNDYVAKNNIEELMINDDGEEKNIIYGNVGEDGKITNMIIYNDDNEEVDVVCIWGTFEIKGKEDKRSHKGNSKSALPGVTIPSETIVIPDSTSNSVTVK